MVEGASHRRSAALFAASQRGWKTDHSAAVAAPSGTWAIGSASATRFRAKIRPAKAVKALEIKANRETAKTDVACWTPYGILRISGDSLGPGSSVGRAAD